MKYLKRLKNELLDLSTKLSVKGHLPEYVESEKMNRRVVVRRVIELVKRARALDFATDTWNSKTAAAWAKFNTEMGHWLASMPQAPKADEVSAPTNNKEVTENPKCKIVIADEGYGVTFWGITEQELLSVRNAMAIHAATTQEGEDILQSMIDALKCAGINLGDCSYPLRPWERKKPDAA